MPKKIITFLFLFFLSAGHADAKEPTFLLIHQIRGKETCCQSGSFDLVQNLKKRKDLHTLSFGWALRFDALEDDQYLKLLEGFGEAGLLLEITPDLASKSGILYKGKADGSDWYFAKNAFLVGYEVSERKKIIDTLFDTFKQKFGFYPGFTVSWMIDAWSLNYIQKNYQIKLHELTKEQYETDSYTLYGGVFNAPYYPTRKHPLIPGRGLEKLDLIVVRQTISDILYNYGFSKAYYTSQPNDYLENPQKTNISYFQTLIEDVAHQPSEFQFGVLGFENSYSWQKYGEEYLRQLEFIAGEQKQGKLKTVLPGDYALKFRKEYQDNPSFYFVKDFSPEEKLGVLWYFGETYRARIILKEGKVIIDDLRIYLSIDDPYKENPSQADYSYWIVPYLIDGSQQYSLEAPKGWPERLNHPRGSPKGFPWGERGSKALEPPGGSLTSDTLTSPFGIILGEDKFNLKTGKSDVVEIEFTGEKGGLVKLLPQEILIDESLKPSFTEPYQLLINDLFNTQEEVNLPFKRQFDFTIRSDLKTPRLNHPRGSPEGFPWGEGSNIALGWTRNDNFISLFKIEKRDGKFRLFPELMQENLSLLAPMFQPDLSGLTVDPKKSVFYWNNKEAVAGRNPVRLFILPLNNLGRPVQIKDIKVTTSSCHPELDSGSRGVPDSPAGQVPSNNLAGGQNNQKCTAPINIVYPDDYSYRITPWFIDISSDIPLKTEIDIVVDGAEVIKDIPIEFITDCQKSIKACIFAPRQLAKYMLILLNEQKIRLSQYFRKK